MNTVLLAAADLIAERGLYRGGFTDRDAIDPECKFCTAGAIGMVAACIPSGDPSSDEYIQAITAVADAIQPAWRDRASYLPNLYQAEAAVYEWSDDNETETVVAKLRELAAA